VKVRGQASGFVQVPHKRNGMRSPKTINRLLDTALQGSQLFERGRKGWGRGGGPEAAKLGDEGGGMIFQVMVFGA
jgi:hypothetical protein